MDVGIITKEVKNSTKFSVDYEYILKNFKVILIIDKNSLYELNINKTGQKIFKQLLKIICKFYRDFNLYRGDIDKTKYISSFFDKNGDLNRFLN